MGDNNESLIRKTEKVENKNGQESSDFFDWDIRKKYICDVGNYISNNLKQSLGGWENRLLTRDEEKELFDRYIETWDKVAFDKIIISNLRFVIYLAECIYKDLKSQYNCRDIYLDDLIQSWSIWLIKAAQEYIPESENRFIFYAHPVVKDSILHYINYENNFFWFELDWWGWMCKVKEMNKYVEIFTQENEREPEDEELEYFYEPIDDLRNLDTRRKVAHYKYITDGNLSIDSSIKELSQEKGIESNKIEWYMWELISNPEDEIYLRDLLIDDESKNCSHMEWESFKRDLEEILNVLTPKQESLLRNLYGLWLHPKKLSIQEISEIYGWTYESIQSLWQRTIERIKKKVPPELLRKYIK